MRLSDADASRHHKLLGVPGMATVNPLKEPLPAAARQSDRPKPIATAKRTFGF